MIDYFSEAALTATVKVSGNLSRVLGVALSFFHRETAEKIARLEGSNDPARHYMIAVLKLERDEFERHVKDVCGLIAAKRGESPETDGRDA